ncbi:MAG: TIGR02206 family membrane protein [Bacteroidetes bacterium]|nr:TIGR02206 family membrane protein [Bacteroidota bacterium]
MTGFALGSVLHGGILLAIVALGATVGLAIRRRRLSARTVPALGLALAASESVWYIHLMNGPWPLWPGMLPLHLCDLTVWLTVLAATRSSSRFFSVAYYWGLAGTTMALLTPDVQGLSWNYPTVQFFISHGLVVATLLAMAVANAVPIDRRSWRTAFVLLHLYAAIIGAFNAVFGTNYLYLMEKPSGATLFDLMGPWPWYLLSADVIGAALFFLLSLPLKRRRPAEHRLDKASSAS